MYALELDNKDPTKKNELFTQPTDKEKFKQETKEKNH